MSKLLLRKMEIIIKLFMYNFSFLNLFNVDGKYYCIFPRISCLFTVIKLSFVVKLGL